MCCLKLQALGVKMIYPFVHVNWVKEAHLLLNKIHTPFVSPSLQVLKISKCVQMSTFKTLWILGQKRYLIFYLEF